MAPKASASFGTRRAIQTTDSRTVKNAATAAAAGQ
jgi:hypothetical protein